MSQPTSIGPYEIIAELGHGTTGIIYKARHPIQRDRLVALKTPRPSPDSERPWRRTCFRMECQLLARLTHEPNLHFASLYDVGAGLPGHPEGFYAREFIQGSTLEQLATARAITLRSGISILASVAKAITLVHFQGFAHRNLHPSNVLVMTAGTPKLIGFGQVWLLAGTNLLPPGVPGVSAEVDVRGLQQMLDNLCAMLGQSIPAPLEETRQPDPMPGVSRFAEALNDYLQA